jgi:hypothetical protein
MDWADAIERNRIALIGIVASLVMTLGRDGLVPAALRNSLLRILRPAEAAARRLIVLAARGLVLKPGVARPMPPGLSQQLRLHRKERGGGCVFKLCDAHVPMVEPVTRAYAKGPRIRTVSPADPTVTVIFQGHFQAQFQAQAAQTSAALAPPDGDRPLSNRLEALQLALQDLPRQARRLVRWTARRKAIAALRPIHTSPLRFGRAPYLPKTPVRDIDYILERCHLLARDAMHADTS